MGAAAPLGPVAAALVPRSALFPAPTPRMMGLRPLWSCPMPNGLDATKPYVSADNVSACTPFRARIARRGGSPREGVRSEARVPLRGIDCATTGGGGRSAPDPEQARLLVVRASTRT